jgi:hypothetical protein
MLNPDGAERGRRRNAQGIDINRDARALETPEGRLLKDLRDRHRPFLGFNLHNQNGLTTVGDTGRVATIALLAVAANIPADAATRVQTPAPGPHLAKKVTAVLFEALSTFVYGHISRYDETYNPRAFGDNMTLWGTPIVLVESGGNPAGQQPDFGVKLNFVGLLAVLNSLASGKVERANPAVFDSLQMNSDNPIHGIILKGAWIFTGSGVPLFRGDVAIRHDARTGAAGESIIADVGDLGVFTAHETVDCTGALLTPGLIAWDPGSSPSSAPRHDKGWLDRGVTTILETASLSVPQDGTSLPEWHAASRRPLNWAFVVTGRPATGDTAGSLRLAEWFAAGSSAWIADPGESTSAQLERIPGWFGAERISVEEASRYRLPPDLAGDPARSLHRWTGDAARRFRLPRRGLIEPGGAADLVLWRSDSEKTPRDLRHWRPTHVLVNGQLLDLSGGPATAPGRFVGR